MGSSNPSFYQPKTDEKRGCVDSEWYMSAWVGTAVGTGSIFLTYKSLTGHAFLLAYLMLGKLPTGVRWGVRR
jgi:hypothetical protein